LSTADDTNCRWSATDLPYASMPNSFSGAGGCNHSAVVSGLSGTLALAVIYVQCEAYADGPSLLLSFRSLPDTAALPFPRLGNLWGSGNFRGHPQGLARAASCTTRVSHAFASYVARICVTRHAGLAYAANRSSLWLGADWTQAEIVKLRQYNAFTVVLTSMNACETNAQDLPDDFYLTNITQVCVCVCRCVSLRLFLTNMTQPAATRGRLQSWPGAWRLDLTNPAVQVCVRLCMFVCAFLTNPSAQLYQAHLMYCLVVFGGSGYGPTPGCANASVPPLVFDGLFVDNVFMDDGEAVNSRDIFGNTFVVLDQVTGKPA